ARHSRRRKTSSGHIHSGNSSADFGRCAAPTLSRRRPRTDTTAKMRFFSSPHPRSVTRPVSILLLAAWVGVMALLVNRSYLQASPVNLATDLARYTSAAAWHGVYYRGVKIGFTVDQTLAREDGFELEQEGRLQMSLLGATTPVAIRTT